jgi:hypothetical protein
MDNEELINGTGSERIREIFAGAKQAELESPRPLRRTIPPLTHTPMRSLVLT